MRLLVLFFIFIAGISAQASGLCEFLFPTLSNGYLIRTLADGRLESYVPQGRFEYALRSRVTMKDGYRQGVSSYYSEKGTLIAEVDFNRGVPMRARWFGLTVFRAGYKDVSTMIRFLPSERRPQGGRLVGYPERLILFKHGKEWTAESFPSAAFRGLDLTAKEIEYGSHSIAELFLDSATGEFILQGNP